MSPGRKDYSHHNYPLERIETAIAWLKAYGNERVAIAGASTTGTLALTAASMFPELTLTIAMTASDFVWQGFAQGKKDTAARSGRSPASRCSLTVGSRCPTCRSAISIRGIGTCSPRRVNARAT